MTSLQKLYIVLGVGLTALILQFGFHMPTAAYFIVVATGSILTLIMLFDMIKVLKSGNFGVDLLAIISIVSTMIAGDYWAALIILIMLTGGDSLEEYASKKAGYDLSALLDNSPKTAHLVEGNQVKDVDATKVPIGSKLLIKPGEAVPIDSIILQNNSTFDESSMTGESRLIKKDVGEDIISGSVNKDHPIYVETTKLAKDSQYQTLVNLVKEANIRPAHFVRLADQYALPFTIISIVIGVLAALIAHDPHRFVQVVVVASPCPLILAAPVALVSGMSRVTRHGIILKTGTALEKLAKAKSAYFDKTGTVTKDQLSVTTIVANNGLDQKGLIDNLFNLELNSNHIMAKAIVLYARRQKITQPIQLTNIQEVTGKGIQANFQNETWKAGELSFVSNNEAARQEFQTVDQNSTCVFFSINETIMGYVVLADEVRPESAQTISDLKSLGINNIAMLTGDTSEIAHKIADQIHISNVYANCLPKDKIRLIQDTKKSERPLIMVGDGVNDAPAIAAADVGIAMGATGASAASQTADVVIIKNDLHTLIDAIRISRYTMKVARESVMIGIVICIGLELICATGFVPVIIGALLQEVVDTTSILWALRARVSKEKMNVNKKPAAIKAS